MPGQEAKKGYLFDILKREGILCVLIKIASLRRSNEYTQHTIFKIKKENHPKFPQICNYGYLFLGSQERVRNSHGK